MTIKVKRSAPDLKLDPRGYERRMVGVQGVEVRAADDGDEDDGPIGFTGHAAVFNSPTLIESWWDEWLEEIERGAFKKTIKEADIRFLKNHNPDLVLARNKAGTLTLAEDDIGLAVDADMAPVSYAQDLAVSLERGDINQMSFAFRVLKEEWDFDTDPIKRTILEVQLYDVAVVTYPAFEDTDAALRSVGFDTLCRSMELGQDDRTKLLRSLSSGREEHDIAPILEAAGEALRRKAHHDEPAESHSVEALKLRHRTNARLHGLAS